MQGNSNQGFCILKTGKKVLARCARKAQAGGQRQSPRPSASVQVCPCRDKCQRGLRKCVSTARGASLLLFPFEAVCTEDPGWLFYEEDVFALILAQLRSPQLPRGCLEWQWARVQALGKSEGIDHVFFNSIEGYPFTREAEASD